MSFHKLYYVMENKLRHFIRAQKVPQSEGRGLGVDVSVDVVVVVDVVITSVDFLPSSKEPLPVFRPWTSLDTFPRVSWFR